MTNITPNHSPFWNVIYAVKRVVGSVLNIRVTKTGDTRVTKTGDTRITK